ncbi:MAG: hypothetical protein IJV85_01245 [Clostridia bacterium]|nr:hypothetical protein [Clostridia bacterium]
MIYINNTLRIRRLDPNCLQLEEYRKPDEKSGTTKDNAAKWRRCGYYGDIKTALLGALSKQLFDCAKNEMTIKEVIAKIDEARAEIIQAIGELKNG